jgi:excinuclease ABC subunit B
MEQQPFELHSPYTPTGDQPQAITKLVDGLRASMNEQTLLGVTGSGKTFTMANIIAKVQRPTIIISHNKTLAAQLAGEFREFFPKNAVNYFVSYYDYYQPEAYVPQKDLYIEKESQINEEIDRLRNAATHDLLTRRDVIIVASVSCIYGLGNPVNYKEASFQLVVGQRYQRTDLFRQLHAALYQRNDYDFKRGTFRVKGEILDIHPAYSEEGIRCEFDDDTLAGLSIFDILTGQTLHRHQTVTVFPGRQFVTAADQVPKVLETMKAELAERVAYFQKSHRPLEAERIEQRTKFDIEMIAETGFCNGIENYSRLFDGRDAGQAPSTLLDYLPKDGLVFLDESHMTIPQLRAMYEGDKSRKSTLVEYGFRLPSALDNRPLRFEEFEQRVGQRIYVSATPAAFELERSKQIVQQLIRPTGLLDPEIEVRPTKHQIDDLLEEIKKTTSKGQRVLVTTLTKRMSEDLTEYLDEAKIKVQYLHSDVDTLERLEILRDLRLGAYDVVVGINLLREGLDLPEVGLVAVLDADKEGFLRSETALMQVMGRAARHSEGHVIMYADRMTGSMQRAIDETKRRRAIQAAYNQQHGITPTTVIRAIRDDRLGGKKEEADPIDIPKDVAPDMLPQLLSDLQAKMELAAESLDFETAAKLRDTISSLTGGEPVRRTKAKTGRGKSFGRSQFGRRQR